MSAARAVRGEARDGSATISVHVLPRSAKEEVAGVAGGVVRIRLTAPPVENRANEALVGFLARALDVPRRRVELVAGGRGRRKIVRVHGMTQAELLEKLSLASLRQEII